jgi:DNA-binding winged helix-turn-helix (wHTH) protein/TolB-like protein
MDRAVSLGARRIDLAIEPPFQLGLARIDPPAHEITISGKSVRIQPQTLKVLVALHDRMGQVATRGELIDRCWDGRIIGDDVINRCISLLRRFAAAGSDFRIETVPRCGYRLTETQAASKRESGSWRWRVVAAGAAVAAAVAGLYIVREQPAAGDGDALTVAVLPFVENSPGRDIHEIATATRASVSNAMAESGYPATLMEQRSAARRPDLIISGELQRAGPSVRAVVQVEETRHGVIVYSQKFDANEESATTLADQIGASIAVNLSRAAILMKLDRSHPSDPAITAQLLNAEAVHEDGEVKLHAYEIVRQLAPRAPNSAIVQYSLAAEAGDSFAGLPVDQRASSVQAGRRAADRALQLAPDFGDTYGLWCSLHSPILLAQCEDHLRKGLSVEPDAPLVTYGLGMILNASGRVDESLQLAQVSLAKNPVDPFVLGRMLRMLEETGDTRNADRLFFRSIRWWPDHPVIYWSRLVGIEARGDYAELERYASEVDEDKLPLNRDAAAQVIVGARAHDRNGVRRVCGKAQLRWTTQFLCMTALADLGDNDRAFAIAYRLFPSLRGRNAADEERIWLNQPDAFSVAVLSSPAAASLRRDPRFLDLAEGSGLLTYWRSGRLPDFCTVRHESVCAEILRRNS